MATTDSLLYEQYLAAAQATLDSETFQQAWRQGTALSLDWVAAYALDRHLDPWASFTPGNV